LIPLKVAPLDNVVDVDVVFLIGFGVRDYTPTVFLSEKLDSTLHCVLPEKRKGTRLSRRKRSDRVRDGGPALQSTPRSVGIRFLCPKPKLAKENMEDCAR